MGDGGKTETFKESDKTKPFSHKTKDTRCLVLKKQHTIPTIKHKCGITIMTQSTPPNQQDKDKVINNDILYNSQINHQ